MSYQAGRGFNYLGYIDGYTLSGAQPAEIEQAVGDILTTKSLVANQTEIFAQVRFLRRVDEGALFDSLFQRLSAGSDRGQRIIDLMNYAGGQTSDRSQFFGAGHGTMRFDARGYVFADRDHMGHFIAFVSSHRHLADHPVVRLAQAGHRFLLDAMDLASGENLTELPFQQFAALFRQHFKNILAQNLAARQTQFAEFPVAIPGDNPVIAVDRVKRQGQRVDDRFGEALMHFGFGGAAIDFLRQGRRGLAGAEVERRDVRRQRCLLGSGVYQPAFVSGAICRGTEGDDQRAKNFSTEQNRRQVFSFMLLVANEKLALVSEARSLFGSSRGQPFL